MEKFDFIFQKALRELNSITSYLQVPASKGKNCSSCYEVFVGFYHRVCTGKTSLTMQINSRLNFCLFFLKVLCSATSNALFGKVNDDDDTAVELTDLDDLSVDKNVTHETSEKSGKFLSDAVNSTLVNLNDERLEELTPEENSTTTKAPPNKAAETLIASIILIALSFLCTLI